MPNQYQQSYEHRHNSKYVVLDITNGLLYLELLHPKCKTRSCHLITLCNTLC